MTQAREIEHSRGYKDHYQPTYQNAAELQAAIDELRETTAVTTPEQIQHLREQLSALVEGRLDAPIIITGPCAEPVELATPMPEMVNRTIRGVEIVGRALKSALHVRRDRGQNTKPRSNEHEVIGVQTVVSYMGDAVNGRAISEREPDPSRMVGAALQARDIEAGVRRELGKHVPAAHEALLLPYEQAFIQNDYLLSTDLPWIGQRTNGVDSEHVQLLKDVRNPVGVKIGGDSDAAHIRELATTLNPEAEAGKLIFMLRVGLDKPEATSEIVAAIKQYAENSVIMYDIHGSTITNEHGEKVRSVQRIIEEIKQLASICREQNMKLHGVHLETTTDETQFQCVDTPDQRPLHPGNVDPQLNPVQTETILRAVEKHLL